VDGRLDSGRRRRRYADNCVADVASRAKAEGASQGYFTDETPARRNALDLASPVFEALLNRLPKAAPMMVMGLIEMEKGRLFSTAIVVDHGARIGRHRKVLLLGSERIFDSNVFEVSGMRFGINICYETNRTLVLRSGSATFNPGSKR
jgi:predicted amidohydrolase